MVSKREFHRQVITYELLSEEPIPSMSLEDIAYETMEGHMSGKFLSAINHVVDGPTMAALLLEQDSSPEFFSLTVEGEDEDE